DSLMNSYEKKALRFAKSILRQKLEDKTWGKSEAREILEKFEKRSQLTAEEYFLYKTSLETINGFDPTIEIDKDIIDVEKYPYFKIIFLSY
ncbi:hypothetical protein KAR04_09860, partial [Candidatus Calescamantes bacterium]|nr:hypothetical protein [Candidatus Calescamantes bacterium]